MWCPPPMRRVDVKALRFLVLSDTIIEAAEQALPKRRARAGGRVINPDRPRELVASWS
jgi:hypothetical protein